MARELILDEVFIHDELNEIPYTLYYDYENKGPAFDLGNLNSDE